MPIDRSFIVQGYGTVVTGSVTSGSVRVGEEVEWQPRGERVRVRSLQNHGQPVEEVHRGMRAAINLAGIHHENVVRGQELAAPSYLVLSRVLTVRLHCLAGARRAIKHRLPARLHLGTAEIMGMVALLDCDRIEPGGWGLAQLFLEGPATAVWGQPFVLRDASAEQTLGGGQVLQPVARKFRRRHLEMIERIERLWSGDTEQRALTVAWFAGPAGVKQADLVRGAGLGPEQARELLDRSLARGDLYEASPTQGRADALIHAEVIRGLEENILAVLRRLHEALPLLPTHDRQKVQAQFASVGNDALVHVTVDRLLLRKRLVGDLRRIALAEFKPKLSANLLKLKDKVVAAYQEAGLKPPKPRSFIPQAGSFASSLDDLFALCVAEGWLVHIKDDFYLHRDAESQMRRQLTARLAQGPGMTVGEIRDFLGAGRVNTVVMCEYLDRLGITRREGEVRILVK